MSLFFSPNGAPKGRIGLAIVAKIPRAESCKTRLVPPLTFAEAAELSRCFLADTAANVAAVAHATNAIPVAVYTPQADVAELRGLFGASFAFLAQRGNGFGERLRCAVDDLLAAGCSSVALIGSDSPTLPPAFLERAVRALAVPGDRAIIGPAYDGGYYLLGVKARHTSLFENIEWSTSRVFVQTLERATQANLEITRLPAWYDVDDAAGLLMLSSEFGGNFRSGGYHAPITRAYLAACAYDVPAHTAAVR